MKKDKPKEVTRHIAESVSQRLWGRAAGRCQFSGHNILLYKSPVTQESVNIAQKAHIYSFSQNGPRGWGQFIVNKKALNNVDNLMLMCHACHKLIDEDKTGEKYSGELLRKWKAVHESRIELVTGITSDKKSHVVFYTSNIGMEKIKLDKDKAFSAIFPNRYPVSEHPVKLSMEWNGKDSSEIFWEIEAENLKQEFTKKIEENSQSSSTVHFSLFAFAPMPLLIQLGCLFTDKMPVNVYQPIREPSGWMWQEMPAEFEFIINKPENTSKQPVLILSISDKINHSRITNLIGDNVSIWEITVPEQHRHNDCIRHPAQLSMFRQIIRILMGQIKGKHGSGTLLKIFPTMAVSCAIELGRCRMPKADMPWLIYDYNNDVDKFIKTITIG